MDIKAKIKALIKEPVESIIFNYVPFARWESKLKQIDELQKENIAIKNFLIGAFKNLTKEQLKDLFYEYRHEKIGDLPLFLKAILDNYTWDISNMPALNYFLGQPIYVADYLDMVFEKKKGKKK